MRSLILQPYTSHVRPALFLAVLALSVTGCADRNLVGEEVWPDERLAQAEVGFGWNYEVGTEEAPSRSIDILVQPDNSYKIQISEYRMGAEPETLSRSEGNLAPETAKKPRRSLAQLRSEKGPDLFTTLPDCPEWAHPAIEYYVGFELSQEVALTVIERHCKTPETVEGRKIVTNAFALFPEVDHQRLVAGSTNLSRQQTTYPDRSAGFRSQLSESPFFSNTVSTRNVGRGRLPNGSFPAPRPTKRHSRGPFNSRNLPLIHVPKCNLPAVSRRSAFR